MNMRLSSVIYKHLPPLHQQQHVFLTVTMGDSLLLTLDSLQPSMNEFPLTIGSLCLFFLKLRYYSRLPFASAPQD